MKVSALLVATALAACALPAAAQVSVNIHVPGLIQVAPPAPRYEPMPGPRAGQVWVPGHWQWNERAYVWRSGYWQAARPDHAYAPGRWVQADGGWRWMEGNWRRAEQPHHAEREGHGGGGHHCPPGQAKKGRC